MGGNSSQSSESACFIAFTFAITSRDLTETARQAHNTSPIATAALGRAMSGALMMADTMNIPEDAPERRAIAIRNPLGPDFSIMRTTPLNGMLTSLATNYNRRNKAVRLYETGNVYLAKSLPLTELPDERMKITLGMYGDGDFFDLKGVVELFFEKIGMTKKPEYPSEGAISIRDARQRFCTTVSLSASSVRFIRRS